MTAMRPVRKMDILAKDLDGETLLYDDTEEAIHVLNPTAKLVWELCDGEHTVEDIERKIRESFSVAEDYDVMRDIQRTMETFIAKGLLLNPT